MSETEALLKVADELDWIFWLIFWFGILGAFGSTVTVQKNSGSKRMMVRDDLNLAVKALVFYANNPYIFDESDEDTEQLHPDKPWRYTSGKLARETLAKIRGEK